jgi:rSAM-associated Gly-rich repeat protein
MYRANRGGGEPVTLRQKYLKVLSALLPAGAVGAALLLGSAGSATAKQEPVRLQPQTGDEARVSDRLAAIRGAVSEIAGSHHAAARDGSQLAWWGNWRNGGGGYGVWRNGGWRNAGWLNGGWRNGGAAWRNGGWPNFWRNW